MNGSNQNAETNTSNQYARPQRDKRVLSALLNVFLRNRASLTAEGAAVGLRTSIFPFAQSRQECPHLGALESFYLARPSDPFLGNFLHISKPQMYP